uniref:Uncharacterized protein n=1 Tax=Panagrolaimus superbus TaxID=310955 RepID=A0A914Z2C9_9BILA
MSDFTIDTIKECSKHDKEIYGFAKIIDKSMCSALTNVVFLTLYGAQSKKDIAQVLCDRGTFVREFMKVFKDSKLKAFIFQIDGTSDNVDFIRCMHLNVSFTGVNNLRDIMPVIYFTTTEWMRSAILIAADVDVKSGDRIVEVLIDPAGYVVSELEYTEQGYLEREQRDCKPYKSMTPETIRQRILGQNDPVKIICHANLPGMESTKYLANKVLHNVVSSKLQIMEEDLNKYDDKFVFETVKWMLNKSYTKFYVCQKSFRNYMIASKFDGKHYPLILCKKEDVLPFTKTVTIPRSFLQFVRAATDNNDIDIIENTLIEIPKEVHALKFTLEIDESNFIFADVRGLIFNKVSRLPAQLDAKKVQFPVIGFYGELSFMYVKDDDDSNFKLLDSWNGKLGKDLYISFDEEKPIFFEKAVKKFLCGRKKSVIHDIIKVMSTPPTQLSSLESFGYTIFSDENHPVLMIVENFAEENKGASPAFLMALLLREHLKELKMKFGKKPNKIGFCLFDDFETGEAKKRVENGLKESCKMLNGLECSFFEAV